MEKSECICRDEEGCSEYGLLGKGTGQTRPRGGCGSGALSHPGDEAVLGLEWAVLLTNPSVAPRQLCKPWLRPGLATGMWS